jgi:RNA-binding protein Musashi
VFEQYKLLIMPYARHRFYPAENVDKLRKYFGTYGSVQDAVVMKDPVSRRSRGFGFITFYDIASVDNALAHEPHTIDARKV